MKKIQFAKDVLPHLVAIGIFLIVTFIMFSPVFFESKALNQGDITQWEGSSKAMRDYRNGTGEEPLWSDAMFSGMPGYLVNVEWSNTAIAYLKRIVSLNLPHPICNIYLAFISYYIMLLAFGVRPYLAIAGALAFGLSSHLIVGLSAGHSGRIGAIAFMPLVMAGIHLVFTQRKLLGFAVTTAGMALHLRENHLQITYYLLIIVVFYGIVQLVRHYREQRITGLLKNIGILAAAVVIAVGSFFGPLWAVSEYTKYSRGGSDLKGPQDKPIAEGIGKSTAFSYNYAILEPMTLLIPNFYGGSGSNYLAMDRDSETYKALSRAGSEQEANQLASYSSAYWGPVTPAPYYAGAIIVFLFVAGLLLADRMYAWWLLPVCALSIMLCWGANFSAFNYFMYDYLPGYNKFRSVTFALIMVLFSLPLLAMVALEKIMTLQFNQGIRKKLLIAGGITGGICVVFVLFAGVLGFMREGEEVLPGWFTSALAEDRKGLLRSDAFRSLSFIIAAFVVIWFQLWKKVTPIAFYTFIIFFVTVDLVGVDRRVLTKDNYKRKREAQAFAITAADQEILKDKSYYRVYNLNSPFTEARTSYFHHSVGGYHGAKIKRYNELNDSCLMRQTQQMISNIQRGNLNMQTYGVLNMLNIKYIVFGPGADNVIPNPEANGNAWFVQRVTPAANANEALAKVCTSDMRTEAIVEGAAPDITYDSAAKITLTSRTPRQLTYESESGVDGLAVFSEIYYPVGWKAAIDGREIPIQRVDYVLRALSIPAGRHTIVFRFDPPSYVVGNKVTATFSWLVLLILLGGIGWTLRNGAATVAPVK